LDAFTRARALNPKSFDAATLRAKSLATLGHTEQALTAWQEAAVLNPADIGPQAERATLLQELGHFEEAGAILRSLQKRAPRSGEIYRLLTAGEKLSADDPLIPAMQAAWADRKVKGRDRAHLGFALTKAMSDTGQAERMFDYLHPANAELRRLYPDEPQARADQLNRLRAAFQGADFSTPRGAARDSFQPILVTGLPRSGTTLVEDILARHSRVTAAGEVPGRLDQVEALLSDGAGGLRSPDTLDAAALDQFSRAYEAQLRSRIGFGSHVTDKGLGAPLVLGMIALAVPNAKIILVRRDPRDIGLSIYRNLFEEGSHRYSTDLRAIAGRIRDFEEMFTFWQNHLGEQVQIVQYEDLVADPEGGSRALVAAAGLDWEDACLDPGASDRSVRTISVHQVRQPIYQSSSKGWRRYAAELTPLIEELGLEGEDT
jgi:tetratricopeptide (TPR) repeat protein